MANVNSPAQAAAEQQASSDHQPLRAMTLRELDAYRDYITEEYQTKSMSEIQQAMKEDGIHVSLSQLRKARTKWGTTKTICKKHKQWMIGIYRQRKRIGIDTEFSYNGEPYSMAQLRRFVTNVKDKPSEKEKTSWELLSGKVPREITYRTPIASCRPEEEGSSVGFIEPVPIWSLIFTQDSSLQGGNNDVRADLTQRIVRLCQKHFHNTDYHLQNFEALSEALYEEGRFTDAEEVDRLAVGLAEHLLTSEHRQTILLKGNLACNLDSQGRYDEAEALQVEVLKSLSRSLPDNHEDILSLKSNLSETFRKQGKLKPAQDYSQEVVTTAVSVLGSQHEHTLAYKFILAMILHDQEQFENARDILEEVAEAREKVNGFSDIKTMRTYASLATVHQSLGCWQKATEMNNRLLHYLSETNHPRTMLWTLEFYENLAEEMYSFDDFFMAERVYREVLEKKTALLTSSHPHTLRSKLAIAKALYSQGTGFHGSAHATAARNPTKNQ